MSANTAVDSPSAAPRESVAMATNPGARRSERRERETAGGREGATRRGCVTQVIQCHRAVPRSRETPTTSRRWTVHVTAVTQTVYCLLSTVHRLLAVVVSLHTHSWERTVSRLVIVVAAVLAVSIGAIVYVTARRPSPSRAQAGNTMVAVPAVPTGAVGAAGVADPASVADPVGAGDLAFPAGVSDPRIAAARTTAADMRVVAFLRSTLTMAEMLRAERGGDPANVSLHVVRVGPTGLRLTAVDHPRQRQCDVFAGDSAFWAFGYAFDPRAPACGKIR